MISDYEVKTTFQDNHKIKYEGSLNRRRSFKPYKWYHFVLFFWGLMKFYIEVMTSLAYAGSDWFWFGSSDETKFGKDFHIAFIPKYRKKAVLIDDFKVGFESEVSETKHKIIDVENLDLIFIDDGKGKLWDVKFVDEKREDSDYLYDVSGKVYEFSIERFKQMLVDFFNKDGLGKKLECTLEDFLKVVQNSIITEWII